MGWVAACPFFGCKITLINGTDTSNYGISIGQEGNLTISKNCGSDYCKNGFEI